MYENLSIGTVVRTNYSPNAIKCDQGTIVAFNSSCSAYILEIENGWPGNLYHDNFKGYITNNDFIPDGFFWVVWNYNINSIVRSVGAS